MTGWSASTRCGWASVREGTDTFGQRFAAGALALLTALVLVFLVAPILIIVPLSFSSGSFFYYPLPGLSLRWYEDFFTSSFWLSSLKNSLIIGISATVLATVLGTVAALGIPFVVITVLATLSGFDRTLIRAAESLGASQITTFRRVTLPLILPGVASGAVFAFAASFDEVVVVLLMAGPGQRTLPRQMFAGINDNISLTIAAAATMLIAISLVLMIAVTWLQRRSARMRQGGD